MSNELQWITDSLPKLELSLSNGYSWRSARVIIYHEIYGREFAILYASDGKNEMWWRLAHYFGESPRLPLGDVLGWLPSETLPGRPESA